MKAKMTKVIIMLLLVLALTAALPTISYADSVTQMEIALRIEGASNTIYNSVIQIPYSDSLTVRDLILFVDETNEDITVIGANGASPYITEINGEYAGMFGGWDGWLFTVNGEEAITGIDVVNLKDGDSVLFYFGDPYGVGMQYPEPDLSDINDGVISFFSKDTVYDEFFNPSSVINPVIGLTVRFDNDTEKTYITDEEGKIKLDPKFISNGTHKISIGKTAENGLPLVLRFEPEKTIEISIDDTVEVVNNPPTSDVFPVGLIVIILSLSVFAITKRRLV